MGCCSELVLIYLPEECLMCELHWIWLNWMRLATHVAVGQTQLWCARANKKKIHPFLGIEDEMNPLKIEQMNSHLPLCCTRMLMLYSICGDCHDTWAIRIMPRAPNKFTRLPSHLPFSLEWPASPVFVDDQVFLVRRDRSKLCWTVAWISASAAAPPPESLRERHGKLRGKMWELYCQIVGGKETIKAMAKLKTY